MFKATGTAAEQTPTQQQLLRLNLDFLALLTELSQTSLQAHLPHLALRAESAAALARCDAAGLQRMAACGFSLFSLSLHRADLWQQAVIRSQSQAHERRYLTPLADSTLQQCSGFMACAVFFAWHLAQQAPQQARLLLGMSADTTAIVNCLELWQCQHIAHAQQKLLSPRWRHHGYFWSDLLSYGTTGDAQHFKFAQLLGSQLMAQELEPSAILRLSSTD